MSELKVTVLGRQFSWSMYLKKYTAPVQWPTFSQALIRLEYVITERSQPAAIIWSNMCIACAAGRRFKGFWTGRADGTDCHQDIHPPVSGLLAGADEMEKGVAGRSQPARITCLNVRIACA